MGIIKCVVPGCEDRHSPRHRFPVFDQEVYEEWLKRIGNKELIILDPKFVGTNKRICSVHFSTHCRIPNSTKLKNRSLPTLHLPDFDERPNEDNSILKYPCITQTISRAELIQYVKDFKPDPEDDEEIKSVHQSVPSEPVAVQTASLPPATIRNHLPENKTITKNAIQKKPPFKYTNHQFNQKDTSVITSVCTTSTPDDEPADDSTEPPDESTGVCEPVTIDFTYLMKITSLPDTPLIEETPKNEPISEPLQDVAQKSAADGLQHSFHGTTVSETSSCGNLISFDLEELVREHCVDIHTEPVTPLVHSVFFS